jgi:hypothetical protein
MKREARGIEAPRMMTDAVSNGLAWRHSCHQALQEGTPK